MNRAELINFRATIIVDKENKESKDANIGEMKKRTDYSCLTSDGEERENQHQT